MRPHRSLGASQFLRAAVALWGMMSKHCTACKQQVLDTGLSRSEFVRQKASRSAAEPKPNLDSRFNTSANQNPIHVKYNLYIFMVSVESHT